MIDKSNKVYSIFSSDVIVTNDKRINAVMGYDVKEKANVASYRDVIEWFKRNKFGINNVPPSRMYLFTNPIGNESWYVGNHILAHYKERTDWLNKKQPQIIAFVYRPVLVVTDLDTVVKYKELFGNITSINLDYEIGYLSTPHKAFINSDVNSNIIKIPLRITV